MYNLTLLSSIVKGFSAGAFLSNDDGEIVFSNEKIRNLLNYSNNELLGLNIRDIVNDSDYSLNNYPALLDKAMPFVSYNGHLVSKQNEQIYGEINTTMHLIEEQVFLLTCITDKPYNKQALIDGLSDFDTLTSREKHIFRLLLRDTVQRDIAGQLNISINTVKFHVSNIYGKMGINSMRELKELKDPIRFYINSKNIESVFNYLDDAITVHDKNYSIIFMNKAAKNLFNTTPGSNKCYQIFHGMDSPPENCMSCYCWKTRESSKRDYYEPFHAKRLEIKAFPIIDRQGNMVALIHQTRDITKSERMREELLKSQKLESLGVLAGGIAHDFNNLLAGIFGTVSLARQISDDKSEASKVLAVTEQVIERTRDLTCQLLTFSEGGAPVKSTVSLAAVIEDTASYALHSSNVRLDISLPKDLRDIEADKEQISQVLANLIINAEQAMPEGGLIEVSAENREVTGGHPLLQEGGYVALMVSDTGRGIRPEAIPNIFDPFFSTKEGGSGLGLATVYSIVARHGGTIDVKSDAGKGTTFTVYLPASEKKAIKEETMPEQEIQYGSGRVLLMDDEEVIRHSTGMVLDELGYDVVSAINGEEALEKYAGAVESGNPFDVVILDLTIVGGMGGEETMERFKETYPGARVIVSSGYSKDPVLSEYEKYGFSAALRKPYNMAQISKVLKDVLELNP